jgi:Mn2+/Fe2+ NRAMP family transporter
MAGRPVAQTEAGRSLGVILNFTPIDPIKALYWSAVINGILAAPVMVMLMLLVRNRKVMGDLVVRGWLYALGWASTFAMAFCIVGMFVSLLFP